MRGTMKKVVQTNSEGECRDFIAAGRMDPKRKIRMNNL